MNHARGAPRLRLFLAAALSFASADALADVTKDQCIDANGKAQELRRDGKLAAAREQLRACANPACPALVRDDCTKRLDELEKAQPTIVFRAKDASGRDVSSVQVTVDGRPLAEKLDGTALPVDPGEHVFAFTAPDRASVTLTFVVGSGEKERREVVVLGAVPSSTRPAAPKGTEAPAGPAPPQGAASNGSAAAPASPFRTVGWVLGGAGVLGLGLGTVFGIVAIGDKNGAHCGSNDLCDPGTSSGIKSAALASDVGLIAGGVLLASGAAFVLFGPGGGREATAGAGVRVAPVVTKAGGTMVIGGSF